MTAMSLPEGEQMKTARPTTHQVKPAKKEMSHCTCPVAWLIIYDFILASKDSEFLRLSKGKAEFVLELSSGRHNLMFSEST